MAVLPTPGSPTSSGLFLVRRHRDLNAALDLVGAADQGIDLTLAGFLVEVDAIGLQGLAAGLHRRLFVLVARALGRPHFRGAGLLGDAVGDEIDRVIAGHLLLLQEVGRVALALGEHGHKHIGAGNVVASGRLDVDHRPLDHPLETRGRLGVFAVVHHKGFQLGVDVLGEALFEVSQIDVAGAHHRGGVGVVDQRQEQMLQGRIFVFSLGRIGDGAVQGFFEVA